jgi:hypothetical protein
MIGDDELQPCEKLIWDMVTAACLLPLASVPYAAALLCAGATSLDAPARYRLVTLLGTRAHIAPTPEVEAFIRRCREHQDGTAAEGSRVRISLDAAIAYEFIDKVNRMLSDRHVRDVLASAPVDSQTQ